ncbi:TlpA disulfide reductase family protein [Hymenobacter sp. BT559]|uniref:TlpA disulfide reductase family protein n=1 Tax=Hymenobacter sp. BT559 TaxID=2795729 RepID=UPI0018EB4489|nr:TlpA disulfide reductase family protein [Hymenobacter sp. BT559]MBJ6143144.1 AhpC/TSA family protein [Hymenobacter sp. BT559]
MKTLLTVGLAALLASPCFAQTCRVAGTIAGLGSQKAIYHYTREGQRRVDTLRIINDQLAQAINYGDDGMANLEIRTGDDGSIVIVNVWAEPGTVRLQGTKQHLDRIEVTGTPENDLLTAYKRAVLWQETRPTKSEAEYRVLQAKQSQQTRQFIQAHAAARTSAYLLYDQTMAQPAHPVADYEKLLQGLKPAVRQSWYGQQAAKRITVLRNQPTVGKPVADFSMADTMGVKHSLATYRGKYVLLDFWGHWCGPCIRAMPKVNALHQQYPDKLAIIGIAMEDAGDAKLWKQAIRKHQVPGLQLSELQQDQGPVISGYNINAFPTYMLLDPKGALVMRTSSVDDITKKLATLGAL